jgi:hypothetical protein
MNVFYSRVPEFVGNITEANHLPLGWFSRESFRYLPVGLRVFPPLTTDLCHSAHVASLRKMSRRGLSLLAVFPENYRSSDPLSFYFTLPLFFWVTNFMSYFTTNICAFEVEQNKLSKTKTAALYRQINHRETLATSGILPPPTS